MTTAMQLIICDHDDAIQLIADHVDLNDDFDMELQGNHHIKWRQDGREVAMFDDGGLMLYNQDVLLELTLPLLDQTQLPEACNELDRTPVVLTAHKVQQLLDAIVHVVEGRIDDTNLDELIELTDTLGLCEDQSERLDD